MDLQMRKFPIVSDGFTWNPGKKTLTRLGEKDDTFAEDLIEEISNELN